MEAGSKNSYDFSKAFERIQIATGCHTQQELANLFDFRQSSISDALKRQSIPSKWLLHLVKFFNLNPDWILFGFGPKHLHEFSRETPQLGLQTISNAELLAELGRRLNLK